MCENNSLIQRMVCQTWLINVHLSMVLLLHNRIVIKAPLGKAHQTVARDCKAVRTCVLFYCNIFKTPFLHNFVRNKQCEINKSQREREREIAAKRRSQPEWVKLRRGGRNRESRELRWYLLSGFCLGIAEWRDQWEQSNPPDIRNCMGSLICLWLKRNNTSRDNHHSHLIRDRNGNNNSSKVDVGDPFVCVFDGSPTVCYQISSQSTNIRWRTSGMQSRTEGDRCHCLCCRFSNWT